VTRPPGYAQGVRRARVLLSLRWLALHLLAVVLVVLCLRLGWWQWQRVGEGSPRSLGYALEWPAIAIFIVVVWAHLVRDTLREASGDTRAAHAAEPARSTGAQVGYEPDDEEDDEVAAYNAYLARLNAAYERRQRR